MIKLVYCLRKRTDISAEEFRRYWLHEHGPAVTRFANAIGGLRYVQSHTVAPALNEMFRASRNLAAPFDGITEVWYDSADYLMACAQTPEGKHAHAALLEDERRFIDFENSCVFMSEEHELFDRLPRQRP